MDAAFDTNHRCSGLVFAPADSVFMRLRVACTRQGSKLQPCDPKLYPAQRLFSTPRAKRIHLETSSVNKSTFRQLSAKPENFLILGVGGFGKLRLKQLQTHQFIETKMKEMTVIKPIDTSEVKAPMVSLKYAAELTGVPVRILRRYIKPVKKIGNHYFARVESINEFVTV